MLFHFMTSLSNTFKYIVLRTDGKISVRIILLFYLYFVTVFPSNICMFLSCRPFVVVTTFPIGLMGVEVTSVSWLGQLTEFKSLIIVIVGFLNFEFLFVAWPGLLILEFKSLMWGEYTQTSPHISDLNSKINSPGQTTNKNSKF